MTEDDLSVLAALEHGASAAPWHVCFANDGACMSSILIAKNPSVGREYHAYGDEWHPDDVVAACLLQETAAVSDGFWHENARLIATVRNHLSELLRLARIGLTHEQRESGSEIS